MRLRFVLLVYSTDFIFFMGKHFLNTAVLYSFILILLQCDLYVKIIYLYTKNVSAALTEMSYGDLKKIIIIGMVLGLRIPCSP